MPSAPSTSREITRIRSEAAALRKAADRLDNAADRMEEKSRDPVPALRGSAVQAAEYVRDNRGKTGDEISLAIGISHGHFRNYVSDQLQANGFRLGQCGGFFPPLEDVM